MKLMFVPAKSKLKLDLRKFLIDYKILPKTIAIAYSVQFQSLAFEAKKILEKDRKITLIVQVLGCSNPRFPKETEAILHFGEGKFHAVALSFESGLPVYVYEDNKLLKVSHEDVEKLEKKRKAAILNFLNSDKVGVLISTKPGQQRLKRALEIKDKFPDKQFYFFLENTINIKEFENFGIKCWVNTACPRLNYDYAIMNLTEIEKLYPGNRK